MRESYLSAIPVAAANRFNTPEVAEEILSRGSTALVNTCIACNQACLGHTFERKEASCLVNPPTRRRKCAAVVGAWLHTSYGDGHQEEAALEVDSIVVCAGQESVGDLAANLIAVALTYLRGCRLPKPVPNTVRVLSEPGGR